MNYSVAGSSAPTIETCRADEGGDREQPQQGRSRRDEDLSQPDLIAYLAGRLDVSSEVALVALGNCLLDPAIDERRAKYVRANRERSGGLASENP
jgi:hypothetical protein